MEHGRAGGVATVAGLLREIEELRASRARLASTSDTDRRSIERALHEGVQQDLVGLAAGLEIASRSLDRDPVATRALLDDLRGEARRALAAVQELADRVFPALLQAGGMVPELRAAASRAGVPATFVVELDGAVPPAPAGALFFCVIDVFDRVAAGTPVEVSVRHQDGALAFEVVAGCDLGSERRASHDRIEALEGTVTITSGADRTIVAGSVPLPR